MIRVVLADDEQKICQLITKLVDWDGLKMELAGTAYDGVQALELIRQTKPDLILTDIRMPGYDGLELIEQSQAVCPDAEFVIISGYSQFSYAQAAIRYGVSDYILKPVNRTLLNDTLKKVGEKILQKHRQLAGKEKERQIRSEDERQLRENLWRTLEEGSVVPDPSQVNLRFRFRFAPGLYRCFQVCFAVKTPDNLQKNYVDHLLELIAPRAKALFDQYMLPLCHDGSLFMVHSRISGLLNFAPDREEQVGQVLLFLLGRLSEEARIVSDVEVYLAAGGAVPSLDAVQETIPVTEQLLCQRFLTPQIHLLIRQDMQIVFDQDALFKPLSDSITKSMEVGEEDAFIDGANAFFKRMDRMQLNGRQLFKAMCGGYHVFVLTGVFHKGYQLSDREALERGFAQRAALCADRVLLQELFLGTCLGHMRDAAKALSAERLRPMQQAMRYMQEHFREDIGLEEVSSAVGFSSSYFSTMFRKETGRSFLEYLTSLRMDAARELLRDNGMRIEAIGKAVGLSDYKRFARTFKKEVGISPGEYRNLYARGNRA